MPDHYSKAQSALKALKDAVLSEIDDSPKGLTNAEIVKRLGLASEYEGKNRNYLSWSMLGLLLNEGKVRYHGSGRGKRYVTKASQR